VEASILSSIFVVVLALYPENIIHSTPGELFALASGIVLLFVPQSALAVALAPYDTGGIKTAKAGPVYFLTAGFNGSFFRRASLAITYQR